MNIRNLREIRDALKNQEKSSETDSQEAILYEVIPNREMKKTKNKNKKRNRKKLQRTKILIVLKQNNVNAEVFSAVKNNFRMPYYYKGVNCRFDRR